MSKKTVRDIEVQGKKVLVTPSTPDVTPSTPSTPDVTPSTPSSTPTPEPLTISIKGENSVWYDENLTLTVEYSRESEEAIVWTSSDEAIATVENGVVTPKRSWHSCN